MCLLHSTYYYLQHSIEYNHIILIHTPKGRFLFFFFERKREVPIKGGKLFNKKIL
ncbi:hypothetical protein MtrunA17_Chr2g0302341 [Medicago truncatula]|uniref:Uncharacterized protein n=1 Tax=Medicago truncatula TaxID=3880 RepID=A0A396J6V9_MEDTR|nr:hypothetical protein MtrunA17_Chr2g0302341 [Medicago truncatula]